MGMLRELLHASARKRFQMKVGGKLCYFSFKKPGFKSGEYNVKLWIHEGFTTLLAIILLLFEAKNNFTERLSNIRAQLEWPIQVTSS